MTKRSSTLAYPAAAALVLTCASCGHPGPTAPPSSTTPTASASRQTASRARIAIISPTSHQKVHARTVHVKVRLILNGPTHPRTPQTQPGWLHLYLDGKVASIQPVVSSRGLLESRVGHLGPGRHLLKAEFVQPSHLPWRPAVAATVTFTVKQPEARSTGQGGSGEARTRTRSVASSHVTSPEKVP
jgi:hypothetical protein